MYISQKAQILAPFLWCQNQSLYKVYGNLKPQKVQYLQNAFLEKIDTWQAYFFHQYQHLIKIWTRSVRVTIADNTTLSFIWGFHFWFSPRIW